MGTVLIIGAGDLGERVAAGLAAGGRVRRVVLVGRSGAAPAAAATVASCADCLADAVTLDATSSDQVAALLIETRPDLVIQCASLRGPWALAGRDDPAARAVAAAGFALRLPYQLPVLLAVMRAAREAGYTGPVANLSLPDVTGPVLARLGLAPTVGLGNAAMILMRVRAVLRAGHPAEGLPLVRVLAHHAQVGGSMTAKPPADPADRASVFLGEDGIRGDDLAYRAVPLDPGARANQVTAASALPVLHALLPGGGPLRWSAPSPGGLPGGYPVRVEDGSVSLDLPPALGLDEAVGRNERMARGDGVERIADDGTVHFTAACRDAVAGLDPGLAEPLSPGDLVERAARLDAALALPEAGRP